jgi:hypothetical protein
MMQMIAQQSQLTQQYMASMQAQLANIEAKQAAQALPAMPDIPAMSDPNLAAMASNTLDMIKINPAEGECAAQADALTAKRLRTRRASFSSVQLAAYIIY